MYPVSTSETCFSQETFDFILARNFGNNSVSAESGQKLREIADLAFDLLSRIQKTEKLRKLGQLGKKGEEEFDSNIRLIGIIIHMLRNYQYNDAEMMSGLEKKYRQISPGISGQQV